jgi:hypothetical protein
MAQIKLEAVERVRRIDFDTNECADIELGVLVAIPVRR